MTISTEEQKRREWVWTYRTVMLILVVALFVLVADLYMDVNALMLQLIQK